MMRLQPTTGSYTSAPPSVVVTASGDGAGFETTLATNAARQGLPGGTGIVVPGGAGIVLPAGAGIVVPGGAGIVLPGGAGIADGKAASQGSSAIAAASDSARPASGLGSPAKAIPVPLQIGASLAVGAVLGNPIGVVETVFMGMVGELAAMGPDLSRPAVPAGFQQTHCKAGVEPVSPGTLPKGAYLSLGDTNLAASSGGGDQSLSGASDGGDGAPTAVVGLMAHYAGMDAYQRRMALERGIY